MSTKKPANAKKRRERSHLSEADCLEVFRHFSRRVVRFAETSDPSAFRHPGSAEDRPAMGAGHINVQFMVNGSYGAAEELFNAIRVLGGWYLPRKD